MNTRVELLKCKNFSHDCRCLHGEIMTTVSRGTARRQLTVNRRWFTDLRAIRSHAWRAVPLTVSAGPQPTCPTQPRTNRCCSPHPGIRSGQLSSVSLSFCGCRMMWLFLMIYVILWFLMYVL